MSQYDIMHEQDNQREAWPSIVEAQSLDVRRLDTWLSLRDLNHGPSWSKPRDYTEITLFRQWKGSWNS